MLLLILLGNLTNSLPITPGDLGIWEAAMASLFKISGLTGDAETILGWRLMMIIVSSLVTIFYLKGEKRFVFSQVQ